MSISFVYPVYLWLFLLIPLTIGLAFLGRRKIVSLRWWGGVALRCVLILLIVSALAGIQLHLPSNLLTAVFVFDVSDSISPQEQARGEEILRQSIAAMPAGDQSAVVLFGQDALVERLASEEQRLAELTSIPVSTRTDISSALQLAMALFPNEGSKRLVLLSDGRENLRQAVQQAEIAAMQKIEMVYVPLGSQEQEGEVLVESLKAPAEIRSGQTFDLEVSVQSTLTTSAELQVFADSRLIHNQEINLQPGVNRFTVTVDKGETGFHRYRALILPNQDKQIQNNEASAFTTVEGPPNILIVEGASGEALNLAQSLSTEEMTVTTTSPAQMPSVLSELAQYDAIVLVNVPASALSAGAMQSLPVYVRDLGRGLLSVGGQEAYGAGGYLRTPLEEVLPVTMEVKSKERTVNLALVLAVDKSGSMGRCHCDSSDLNQSYTPKEVGLPKVDIAKEAIMRSVNALSSQDYLGVVGFDSQAHWALELGPLPDQSDVENSIGHITASGQTNMQAGIQAAYEALQGVDAGRKHIIMLTDGWTRSGDLTGLVHKMNQEGITVSFVAAGGGSADYLKPLAEVGGGRYYPAKDMFSVPDIFLKETVQSVGQYIIEEPFYPLPGNPSPILRGLDEKLMPPLLGYNGTTAKRTARLDLLTPRGDPLLVSWQYGLGKSAAWTSDLKGQWASEWVKWDKFSRFSAQTISWLLPAARTEGLTARAEVQDKGILLSLDARDDQGHTLNNLTAQARVIGPDLNVTEIPLKQVGAGQYESLSALEKPGTYLITFSANENIRPVGQASVGLVVPYSPEYRTGGLNQALLSRLAQTTGGGILKEPAGAFAHNLASQKNAREIWHTLLMIAAFLFPLDVALRRLSFSRRDWAEFYQRFTRPFQAAGAATVERAPRLLGGLFDARQRVRQQQENKPAFTPPVNVSTQPEPAPQVEPQPAPTAEESFSRLRAAKERARKK